MSTEDVTLDHAKKMMVDAKKVAGCNRKCTLGVTERHVGDAKYFSFAHDVGDSRDTYEIPASSMGLMEESALSNFFLARHETANAI